MGGDPTQHLGQWATVGRAEILDASPWLRVWRETVRLPSGATVRDYYALEQPDYVVIFAVTDRGQIPAVWHYKHGPKRINLGLPAGYLRPGEGSLAAAKRELLEECGLAADKWRHLGTYSVDGNRGCGQAHFYMAQDLRKVCEPKPDDLEDVVVTLLDPRELREHLRCGNVATLGAAGAIGLGLNALGPDGLGCQK